MPNELGEPYTFQSSNKIQQSFRMNMDDVNATSATIQYLLLNSVQYPGPYLGQFKINFYEGSIDNLGSLIYTQPYTQEYIDVEIGFVYPFGVNRIYTITGDLQLDAGVEYVLEIEAPSNIDSYYRRFGFKTTESDIGRCNLGTRDIWMKLYGNVTSNTNTSLTIANEDSSSYYLDTNSNFFSTKLLNKFEPENLFINSSLAGNLEYRSSDESIVKAEIKEQETGIKDKIELMGLEDGKAIIYIVHENDTISHLNTTITTKRIIPVSYQYIKYPGESDHSFLTAYSPITERVSEIYDLANVSLSFTNQGIIEYEWDLNGDGKSYTPDYEEFYSAADEIPNSNTYFSNLFMFRQNKTDSFFGGSNGGGSSLGFGQEDIPPRYGWVALHLFRTIESLGETLAHELGHNFGLSHYSSANNLGIDAPNDFFNLMKTGRQDNLIYNFQWDVIHNTIKYRETVGEIYDTRPTAQINNFENTNIGSGVSNYQLTATTNSDSEIIYKLISGDNIIVDNTGNIQILNDGEAEIMAYTYATKNYLDASKKITLTVSNTLSIQDIEDNLIKIYPNPNEGLINIDLKTLESVTVQIFDTRGRIVYNKKNFNIKNEKIRLKGSSGVYTVKVSTINKIKTYKLILK